jgi:hypothetical protein
MKYALATILTLASPAAFAAINLSLAGLVELVIYLIVVGAVLWLLLYLVSYFGLPEPVAKIAKGIIMVIGVLILIGVLLSFVSGSPIVTLR